MRRPLRALILLLTGACLLPLATSSFAACDPTLDAVSMAACSEHEDRERMNSNYSNIQDSINQSIDHIHGNGGGDDFEDSWMRQQERAAQREQEAYEAQRKAQEQAERDRQWGLEDMRDRVNDNVLGIG